MMRLLDLFSGIGGFSLGLERSGGFKTVAFCEIDPFCRRVLAKHWPKVPCYDDVRTLTAAQLAGDGIEVDAICGGFPCQDISSAGKRAGIGGTRSGLWNEYARLVCELRPTYVIVENVSDLLGTGLYAVLGNLASFGYNATWDCIPAAVLGAPHGRDRIWIVAYTAAKPGVHEPDVGQDLRRRVSNNDTPWQACPWQSASSAICRVDDGISHRVDRTSALGNAVVPQIPELIGRAIMASRGHAP